MKYGTDYDQKGVFILLALCLKRLGGAAEFTREEYATIDLDIMEIKTLGTFCDSVQVRLHERR